MRPGSRFLLAALITSLAASGAPSGAIAQESSLTEEQKTLYFLGTMVGRSLQDRYFLEPDEIAVVNRGIASISKVFSAVGALSSNCANTALLWVTNNSGGCSSSKKIRAQASSRSMIK